MAASNRLEELDPALLRPGRFDRQMLVPPPDVSGRERHPRGPLPPQALASDVDLGLARQTAGLTGAELSNLQRGGVVRRPPGLRAIHCSTSRRRGTASSPAQRAALTDHEKESPPTTRPAMPSWELLPSATRSTKSRSSLAAGLSATRSTSRR